MASLPAQVRDALQRGGFEEIPEQYREKVIEYIRWLQEEERRENQR